MDESLLVCGCQAVCDLKEDRNHLIVRHGSTLQPCSQVFPFDELHDQEVGFVVALEAVHGGDDGMVQRCQRSGFPFEAGESFRVGGKVVRQHLDCDVAFELRVACSVQPPPFRRRR